MKNVDETKLKSEFESSKSLRAEFGNDVTSYVEFKKAEVAGRVQVCRTSCSMMSVDQFNDSVELERLNEKLAANEIELERLSGLQKKSAENVADQYVAQYAAAEPCQV